MRTLLALVFMVAIGAAAVDELADHTQTRPEAVDPTSRADITVDVNVHGYRGPFEDAARSLWAVCGPQLGSQTEVIGEPVVADGELRVTVSPAPAHHARTRLRGCLDDVTLDRVKGHLVAVTPVR